MMLIKLFIFFLLLLILPDWYIYRAYIHRVSQKWIRRAYWIPTLFLVTGMTVIFSIHEPMPNSMYRLSNFLLIFLCFAVPKAIFVIVILIMKLLFLISGRRLYGGYIAGVVALASLAYVVYGATEGKQHFQIREVTITYKDLPDAFDGYRILHFADLQKELEAIAQIIGREENAGNKLAEQEQAMRRAFAAGKSADFDRIAAEAAQQISLIRDKQEGFREGVTFGRSFGRFGWMTGDRVSRYSSGDGLLANQVLASGALLPQYVT